MPLRVQKAPILALYSHFWSFWWKPSDRLGQAVRTDCIPKICQRVVGLSQNPMRMSQNPTATATLRVAREQTDNAQLRSKKTSPDLNYTAESKSLQINKERLIVQENPGSTNRLHRRVPRPRLCFRTTRFSPITPNQQDSPILQGGCSADPEATRV